MKSLFLEINPSRRAMVKNSVSDEPSQLNSIFSVKDQSTANDLENKNKNKLLNENHAL